MKLDLNLDIIVRGCPEAMIWLCLVLVAILACELYALIDHDSNWVQGGPKESNGVLHDT
jgi:hypothetical protein